MDNRILTHDDERTLSEVEEWHVQHMDDLAHADDPAPIWPVFWLILAAVLGPAGLIWMAL